MRHVWGEGKELTCCDGTLNNSLVDDEEIDGVVLAGGQEGTAIPEGKSHTSKLNTVTRRENQGTILCTREGRRNVALEQRLVAVTDHVFHDQTRYGAECTDSFSRELTAILKDLCIGLIEFKL